MIFTLMLLAILFILTLLAVVTHSEATAIGCGTLIFFTMGAALIVHSEHGKNSSYCGTTDYIVENLVPYRPHPETNTYITCMQWRKEYVTMPSLPE